MDSNLNYDILNAEQHALMLSLAIFKDRYYLAGGTGLALQLGHRDSVDFDFFTQKTFSTVDLSVELDSVFRDHHIIKDQEDKNTLTVLVDDVKLSFFAYPYETAKPLIKAEHFNVASIEDIGAMKLSAITARSAYKDYVDLYFILHKIELKELASMAKKKFPTLDTNLVLKSLVYFDDIKEEPIAYKHGNNVDIATVKQFLSDAVKNYLSSNKL